MADRVRPYRLRAVHRAMSFETFERTIPARPGWKREYYDGKAHVRPSWTTVTYTLTLSPRPAPAVKGLRAPAAADEPALRDAFLDSFRYAPEYADYPMAAYRRKAAEYVRGFYGDVRGRASAASAVIVRGGRVLAAALVKEREGRLPLLDCLFVRPDQFRRGLARAVATAAVNQLAAAGYTELRSNAMLANEASQAWHAAFGFRELPDLMVAQARGFCARYELERREKLGILSEPERERLAATAEYWWAEAQRLYRLPGKEAFPLLND